MLVTAEADPPPASPSGVSPFACHVPSNDRPLVSLLESYGNDSLLVSEREF